MQLRKNQTCTLSESDFQVVNELAKVCYVKVLSSQVCIKADKRSGISFKDHISNCRGLPVPSHWVIEWIGGDENEVNITFGINSESAVPGAVAAQPTTGEVSH
jgi:hypothetical protein